MSEQLVDLAIWTSYLVDACHDFREHCCEFSKYLVQKVPDDHWPDIAAHLLGLLDDVEYMNEDCRKRLPATKLPSGTWRIKREDLEAFLAGGKS